MNHIARVSIIAVIASFLFVACGNDTKGTGGSSSAEQVFNQFANANLSAGNTKSLRDFTYISDFSGQANESVYLRVLWAKDHKVSINGVSVDGLRLGQGSHFDNATEIGFGTITEELSNQFLDLYSDSAKSQELWEKLRTDYIGATFVAIKGFSHSDFAPLINNAPKVIPVVLNIEIDGTDFELQDEISVGVSSF